MANNLGKPELENRETYSETPEYLLIILALFIFEKKPVAIICKLDPYFAKFSTHCMVYGHQDLLLYPRLYPCAHWIHIMINELHVYNSHNRSYGSIG